MHKLSHTALLLLLTSTLPALTLAQETTSLPLWEVGAVALGVSQQAYPGAAQNLQRGLALPFVIYRGKYLRADRDGVGIRAVKTPVLEVDIGVAASFGSSSDSLEARRGLPDLGTLVEFGPRLKWNIGSGPGNGRFRLELPLRGVFDLSDHLAHKGVVFEPELVFERRSQNGWSYSTGLAAVWGNQQLADTFYGVTAAQALPDRAPYQAGAGLIAWRLSTSVSHKLSPDLRLFGFTRIDSVAGAANQSSPLVQRTAGMSLGLGMTYTWQRSSSPAGD